MIEQTKKAIVPAAPQRNRYELPSNVIAEIERIAKIGRVAEVTRYHGRWIVTEVKRRDVIS